MPDAVLRLDRKDRGRLECSDPRLLEAVRAILSVPNPSYRFTPFGSPRLHAVTALGTFKSGLAWAVLDAVREAAPASVVDVLDELKDEVEPLRDEGIRLLSPVNPDFEYRDYQEEGVALAIGAGRGCVILPTASGKSLVGYGIARSLAWHYRDVALRILLIVPTIQLVEQFYKDFHDYGVDQHVRPCKFCGATSRTLDPAANVIISNRQWLEKHHRELPHMDAVIVDECLRAGQIIETDNGKKPIEDVKVGDNVLSYNLSNSTQEFKPVDKIFKNIVKTKQEKLFLEISLEDGRTITVTPNHKIYTSNRGYVRADELNLNDDVVVR